MEEILAKPDIIEHRLRWHNSDGKPSRPKVTGLTQSRPGSLRHNLCCQLLISLAQRGLHCLNSQSPNFVAQLASFASTEFRDQRPLNHYQRPNMHCDEDRHCSQV